MASMPKEFLLIVENPTVGIVANHHGCVLHIMGDPEPLSSGFSIEWVSSYKPAKAVHGQYPGCLSAHTPMQTPWLKAPKPGIVPKGVYMCASCVGMLGCIGALCVSEGRLC